MGHFLWKVVILSYIAVIASDIMTVLLESIDLFLLQLRVIIYAGNYTYFALLVSSTIRKVPDKIRVNKLYGLLFKADISASLIFRRKLHLLLLLIIKSVILL